MLDIKLLGDVIALYGDMIMMAAYMVLHDFQLAEDVLQITLFKLLNTERNMEDIYSPKARGYIYKVARNTAVDMYRRELRQQRIFEKASFSYRQLYGSFHDAGFDKYGFGIKMDEVFELLDKWEREIIVLRFYYMFSIKEISQICRITPYEAAKRIKKALLHIKELYMKQLQ